MSDPIHGEALEGGDPLADARAFRRCLGQFSTGVTVVTTTHREQPFGLTANSFSSLSMDPPLVLWSIGRSSRALEAFTAAESFNIHILSSGQVDLAQQFASKLEDKFAGLEWSRGSLGAPLLGGAVAVLECSLEARHDAGDHVLLIGRVRHYARYAGNALVYSQGRFALAADHPVMQPSFGAAPAGGAAPASSPAAEMRMVALLASLGTAMSAALDEFRQAAGVDRPQARAIFTLRDGRKMAIDELVGRSYLTRPAAEDALATLCERRLVARELGQYQLTVKGSAVFDALARQFVEYDDALFAGLPAPTVEAARQVAQTLHDRLVPAP